MHIQNLFEKIYIVRYTCIRKSHTKLRDRQVLKCLWLNPDGIAYAGLGSLSPSYNCAFWNVVDRIMHYTSPSSNEDSLHLKTYGSRYIKAHHFYYGMGHSEQVILETLLQLPEGVNQVPTQLWFVPLPNHGSVASLPQVTGLRDTA